MTILTANHLGEGILGDTVIRSNLPLRAQVLQTIMSDTRCMSGILRDNDVSVRYPDIMASITEQGTAQIIDPGVVIGGLMEIPPHREGIFKGAYFDAREEEPKSGIGKAVSLQAAV